MNINKTVLGKYLDAIAIDQLTEDYTQRGYTVSREEPLGEFKADLIARKGDEQIVFEIKTKSMTPEKRRHIAGIVNYINKTGGYKFHAVFATPPKEKKIEIGSLKRLIADYIIHVELPPSLVDLSDNTVIDKVEDISIEEINIADEKIFLKGEGVVNVEFQYETDGYNAFDPFPFDFEMTLAYNQQKELEIVEVGMCKIDTSSYDAYDEPLCKSEPNQ